MAGVITNNAASLTIGGIYRSPSSTIVESTYLLILFRKCVIGKKPTHLLLVGDLVISTAASDLNSADHPSEEFLGVIH